jgi:biotin synthase
VRAVGLKTCSGGILGMGESRRDRASMLCQLANLPAHPESVPINLLVQVEGTPLFGTDALDPFEFVRTIAAARIMMPASTCACPRALGHERRVAGAVLSGRRQLHLLRRAAADHAQRRGRADRALFARLGLSFEASSPRVATNPAPATDHHRASRLQPRV